MQADPINPPRLFAGALGTATFKSEPADFQVEEILGFEPSGEGEHCFLWLEKIDHNSNDVATHLADRMGIRRRLVSHCGLKDKQAVTRQWFSIHLPGQDSPDATDLETDGIKILKVTRNGRKLRRGSHDGNRFTITLRDINTPAELVEERWENITTRGVPNYFGPQRFGRSGDNIRQAREMLSGRKEIRDRLLRGILISAARSFLFNSVVAQRVADASWDQPLDGEVFGFADNRSLVLPEKQRGDEQARVAAGDLELTAPLWGNGELQSLADVLALESEVIAREKELADGLATLGLRQERRTTRLIPQNPSIRWQQDAQQLILEFDLPKGTYATTILRELFEI